MKAHDEITKTLMMPFYGHVSEYNDALKDCDAKTNFYANLESALDDTLEVTSSQGLCKTSSRLCMDVALNYWEKLEPEVDKYPELSSEVYRSMLLKMETWYITQHERVYYDQDRDIFVRWLPSTQAPEVKHPWPSPTP